MEIKKEIIPYILLVIMIAFFMLGIALDFTPTH